MKKKGSLIGALIRAVVVVMLITAAVVAVMFVLSANKSELSGTNEQTENRSNESAIDRAVKYATETQGVDESKVREILDSMDEKDRETLNRIVSDHMSEDTFAELAEDLSNGDTGEILEFARENLSLSEQLELMEIAVKYGYITK